MDMTHIDFLKDLVGRIYPTIDDTDCVDTRPTDDGGLEVFYGADPVAVTIQAYPILTLYYVRKDDLGHVVKAVRLLCDESTKDEILFYAHGHTLGCLIQVG